MGQQSVKWILADDGLAAMSTNDFICAVDEHDDIVRVVEAAAAGNKMLMTSRVSKHGRTSRIRQKTRRASEERNG